VARARRKKAAGTSGSGSRGTGRGSGSGSGGSAALSGGEQTHLLALFGALCACAAAPDARVPEGAGQLLLQVGNDVGLLDLSPSSGPLALDDARPELRASSASQRKGPANLLCRYEDGWWAVGGALLIFRRL
jgi:hypothetical protein